MSYIGNTPFTAAFLTDTFSGDGSTTGFTLSAAPANTSSIIVAVTGVLQDPSTYSVSGTTLTFSAAPPSGTDNISVRFLGIPASGVTTTAYRTVTEFTATAGQTTFSVPSYTVGYVDVYRNGVMLGTADFTASSGTTIVLASGATAGDLIRVESFYVSSVLNAIPATAGAVNSAYIAGDQTIGFADGTASAPSITNTGDTNTGIYFPDANNIAFTTDGTIRGRWTTDGLCFNSDTAAANALDDYEEGTWSPVLTDESGNPFGMSGSTIGTYTKVGNLVTVIAFYSTTGIGSASGDVQLTGLPFTVENSSARGAVIVGNATSMSLGTAGFSVTGLAVANTTYMYFYVWDSASGTTSRLSTTTHSAVATMYLTCTYRV